MSQTKYVDKYKGVTVIKQDNDSVDFKEYKA